MGPGAAGTPKCPPVPHPTPSLPSAAWWGRKWGWGRTQNLHSVETPGRGGSFACRAPFPEPRQLSLKTKDGQPPSPRADGSTTSGEAQPSHCAKNVWKWEGAWACMWSYFPHADSLSLSPSGGICFLLMWNELGAHGWAKLWLPPQGSQTTVSKH